MKKLFFFFAMFASVAASAKVTVTPISTNYSTKEVRFRVEWTNTPIAPINNRVWIWIDFCPVTGTVPTTSFATATVSNPTIINGNGTVTNVTTRGFFITYSSTNAGTTVTATLSNAPNAPQKFNWCVYGSDYPPNAVINGSSYTLKGTPPFIVNGTNLGAGVTSYSGGCITSITDATGCPGLFPLPTTTSLSANPTSICYGSSAVLTASASGAASYSFDNGSSWQTTTTKTVSPTATTNYTLKVRSSTGCTSADSKTASVTVNALPTTTSLSANPTSICYGSSAVLTALASGATSYSFDNGSSWQTTTTKTVSPTATTNYTLKVRSSTGCISSNSKTASVTVVQGAARDKAPNTCGCATGLTLVGSYCRNLAADAASTYTCSGVVFEVKNTPGNYTSWTTANSACTGTGWRLTTFNEIVCLRDAGRMNTTNCGSNGNWIAIDWWTSGGTGCHSDGRDGFSQYCDNCNVCSCNRYNAKYVCVRN